MNLRRRVSVGLLDQVVVALANAANTILAIALLSVPAASAMLLALTFAYFAAGLGRAFVGEVLLAHAPRLDGPQRRALVRDGTAAALTYGALAGLVLAVLWAFDIRSDLGDLIWVAPAVPAVLLQDTGRQAALADAAPGRALAIDTTWIAAQAIFTVGLVVADRITGGTLLAAWGAGAAVAGLGWLARDRVNPLLGRPARWLASTRHLTGWFTTTAVVAQATTLGVALGTAGVLNREAFALLRSAQVGIMQPVQNLITAMNSLLVPRASRLAGVADAAALRRQTFRAAGALGALGLVVVVVATLGARPLLAWLKPEYLGAAVLALPISIQATIYLMQVPFTAALRGLHKGRALLGQYLVFSVTTLTLLLLGATYGGLRWAGWGLTGGAATGFVVMIAMYLTAERSLTRPAAPAP